MEFYFERCGDVCRDEKMFCIVTKGRDETPGRTQPRDEVMKVYLVYALGVWGVLRNVDVVLRNVMLQWR